MVYGWQVKTVNQDRVYLIMYGLKRDGMDFQSH